MDIQKKLSDYISTELDYWDFSGAVKITQKGKTLLETYRGYANREFGIRNDGNTRFCVASVTKQFTGFAIMLLYDRGMVQLNEKANRYLPSNMQLPVFKSCPTQNHWTSTVWEMHFRQSCTAGSRRTPAAWKKYICRRRSLRNTRELIFPARSRLSRKMGSCIWFVSTRIFTLSCTVWVSISSKDGMKNSNIFIHCFRKMPQSPLSGDMSG